MDFNYSLISQHQNKPSLASPNLFIKIKIWVTLPNFSDNVNHVKAHANTVDGMQLSVVWYPRHAVVAVAQDLNAKTVALLRENYELIECRV